MQSGTYEHVVGGAGQIVADVTVIVSHVFVTVGGIDDLTVVLLVGGHFEDGRMGLYAVLQPPPRHFVVHG